MKAVKIIEPDRMGIFDVPVPEPGKNDVLVKVERCGLCGSDIQIFHGMYTDRFPLIPGHEFSGVVERVGTQVKRYHPGDRVAIEPNIACDDCYACLNNRQNFCLNWEAVGVTKPGAMAQYTLAPEKNVFDIGGMSFEKGAFMEPLSCVLHGVSKIEITISDKVAVFGAGPIGILLLQVVKNTGATEVTVVEKNSPRADFAASMGADEILYKLNALKQDYYDVVIDATGKISVMEQAIGAVRYGGTILYFGVPDPGEKMQVDSFEVFKKGLKLLSSYTSVRNSYQAIELLRTEKVKVENLISHRLPIDDFQKGIEILEQGKDSVKKIMFLPNG